jgi:hypothetical protein
MHRQLVIVRIGNYVVAHSPYWKAGRRQTYFGHSDVPLNNLVAISNGNVMKSHPIMGFLSASHLFDEAALALEAQLGLDGRADERAAVLLLSFA